MIRSGWWKWSGTLPPQARTRLKCPSSQWIRPGCLANVSSAIAECHANISRAEITTREDQKAVLDFVVEISDTRHLDQVLKAVERVEGVITARRMRAWQERS